MEQFWLYFAMMKLPFSFLFTWLILLNTVFAQHIGSVNFTEVKDKTTDSTSQFFYPNLAKRLYQRDTTLTHEEYYFLYYGSVFRNTYHPYGSSNAKKDFNETYDKGNFESCLEKGQFVLKENPVDIEVTLKMIISYLAIGDTSTAKIYGHAYFGFLDVIYSSGDGKTPETAFVVISVDDEYRIVGDLGLQVKQQLLILDCDLLIFSKKQKGRKKKIKKLYFNVQMPLMSLSDTFKYHDLPDPDPDDED